MSVHEIAKQRAKELEAKHQRALDDAKDPAAEFAREEIPRIEVELAQADLYVGKNISVIDWEAMRGMPKTIADLLFDLENKRQTPGVLREMLTRYDALTWKDCWGNRPDGQRDRNRAASIRGGFNFTLARGCVRSIQENVGRLKYELSQFEESIARNANRDVVQLNVPPTKGPELVILTDLNREEN
jgi:hypothetical protein